MNLQNPKIGIIGGTGQMGRFFRAFFEKNGCKVTVASRKTCLTIEDCVRDSDVVIISVPIDKTIEVIESIGKFLKNGSLFMDLTSIKVQPVEAMLKNSGKDVEVIGAHPVFGPGVKSIQDQTIVITPARGSAWLPWLTAILKKNGAKVKVSTPEKHDEMMAVIQCMTHFSNIATGYAIKELGIDVKESLDYTSPIYKLRMGMIGRVLNQDPMLYADIEIMNKFSLKAIDKYLECANNLRKLIKEKDEKEFTEYFNEAADFFGDFKNEATKESDYLIEKMVERKKIK